MSKRLTMFWVLVGFDIVGLLLSIVTKSIAPILMAMIVMGCLGIAIIIDVMGELKTNKATNKLRAIPTPEIEAAGIALLKSVKKSKRDGRDTASQNFQ